MSRLITHTLPRTRVGRAAAAGLGRSGAGAAALSDRAKVTARAGYAAPRRRRGYAAPRGRRGRRQHESPNLSAASVVFRLIRHRSLRTPDQHSLRNTAENTVRTIGQDMARNLVETSGRTGGKSLDGPRLESGVRTLPGPGMGRPGDDPLNRSRDSLGDVPGDIPGDIPLFLLIVSKLRWNNRLHAGAYEFIRADLSRTGHG